MEVFRQAVFAGVLSTLILEVVLFLILIVKKKNLISDKSRKVFEDKINLLPYIGGLFLASLSIHFIGEISELFVLLTDYRDIFETLHSAFLLIALLLIARMTYKMGWVK